MKIGVGARSREYLERAPSPVPSSRRLEAEAEIAGVRPDAGRFDPVGRVVGAPDAPDGVLPRRLDEADVRVSDLRPGLGGRGRRRGRENWKPEEREEDDNRERAHDGYRYQFGS